jgi:hypothetical protein
MSEASRRRLLAHSGSSFSDGQGQLDGNSDPGVMGTPAPHRLVWGLTAVTVAFLLLSGWLLWSYTVQSLRIRFAEDQTAIFEELRAKAVRGGPRTAAECLAYVVDYYPSGTKQVTGSKLDWLVERARARAVADIVAHLRKTTGEDLGDAPERWIAKFARR